MDGRNCGELRGRMERKRMDAIVEDLVAACLGVVRKERN